MQKVRLNCGRVDLMLFFLIELVELEQICVYELLTTKSPHTYNNSKKNHQKNSQGKPQNPQTKTKPPIKPPQNWCCCDMFVI